MKILLFSLSCALYDALLSIYYAIWNARYVGYPAAYQGEASLDWRYIMQSYGFAWFFVAFMAYHTAWRFGLYWLGRRRFPQITALLLFVLGILQFIHQFPPPPRLPLISYF